MSIREIKVKNKNIIGYDLPSDFKKNSENIGNKLEDFEILQVVGQGSFGFVAKVRSKLNSEIYALKKIRPDKMGEQEKLQFQIEKIFSKKFNHPNICKFLSTFEENGEEYFIMKYFNNKDLYRYLNANAQLCFYIKEDILWEIFHQCLEGLTYLHNQGVIHRDIKLGNIFMDENRNIQIGDFGTCAVMEENEAKKLTNDPQVLKSIIIKFGDCRGTPNYCAPEILEKKLYDQRADVYSLGITFYALCFYKLPYSDGKNMDEMKNDNFYSYELKNIIYKMIQRDQNNRPTSSDIYCLFKKEYIKKYVKNSGIYSTIQCFFNYSNIEQYFSNSFIISQVLELDSPKKLSIILVEIFHSLKDANIDEYIYILRQILYKEGINKKDNEEISPLQVLNIILNALKFELNEKKEENEKIENKENELSKSQKNSYLHVEEIPGEQEKKYKDFIKEYNELFNSVISENFRGVLKIKRECENGHSNYLFRIFHYINFNCDLLTQQLNTNYAISINECFNCLNGKEIYLGLRKFVKCPTCERQTRQTETRTFYETPNNLIIAFDRGHNNRNKIKINFEEEISFNSFEVERNHDKSYKLIGVISEIIENGHSKYISFIKKNNKWLLFNIGKDYNGVEIKNFNIIKTTGNLIALFYNISLINSQNLNFNVNFNNLFNNNNFNNNNFMNNNFNNNNFNINNNFNNNFNNNNFNNNFNNFNNNNNNPFNNNNFQNFFNRFVYNMNNMNNMQNYRNFNDFMNNNNININNNFNNNINNNNINNNFNNINNNNINYNNNNNFINNNMNNFNISNVNYYGSNNFNNTNNNMNNNMNNFYNINFMNNLK